MTRRVAFYGNVCNNLYQAAKLLRRETSIIAQLYIDENSESQQRPESDDPLLRGNYPYWIHLGRYETGVTVLSPWLSPLVSELNQADVAILSGLGVMFAPYLTCPAVFLTTGGDLTVYPFPREFAFLYPSLRAKLWSRFIGHWQRLGLRNITEVWTQPFSPFLDALDGLGVPKSKIADQYLPIVLDTDVFQRRPQRFDVQTIVHLHKGYRFVVFHPSRFLMEVNPALERAGQWNKNEVILQGFARFIKDTNARDAILLLIDRPASKDVQMAKEMVTSLGIGSNVLWLKPPRPQGFTRDEMISLYSLSNVVADQYQVGWFGSVTLEALALECPVITFADEAKMRLMYPWHPLLSARTPEAVSDILLDLYKNPHQQKEQGAFGRKWVLEFHSGKGAASAYVKAINRVVRGFDE